MRRPVASAWGDYVEPAYIPGPDEAGVFMGAQVGWSRDREDCNQIGCPRCGGKGLVFDIVEPDAALPIPFRFDPDRHAIVTFDDDPIAGSLAVCASCMRWPRDEWLERVAARTGGPIPVAIPPGGTIPIPLAHVG